MRLLIRILTFSNLFRRQICILIGRTLSHLKGLRGVFHLYRKALRRFLVFLSWTLHEVIFTWAARFNKHLFLLFSFLHVLSAIRSHKVVRIFRSTHVLEVSALKDSAAVVWDLEKWVVGFLSANELLFIFVAADIDAIIFAITTVSTINVVGACDGRSSNLLSTTLL